MSELIRRFGFSTERITILNGLLSYRKELRRLGFVQGFQWLDGSFVENVEAREARPPRDIDLVTFARTPAGISDEMVRELLKENLELFDREQCKNRYCCDTFLIRLGKAPEKLVADVRYWFGVFSHRREDQLWKGLLQLPLVSDDDEASQLLNATQGENHAGKT